MARKPCLMLVSNCYPFEPYVTGTLDQPAPEPQPKLFRALEVYERPLSQGRGGAPAGPGAVWAGRTRPATCGGEARSARQDPRPHHQTQRRVRGQQSTTRDTRRDRRVALEAPIRLEEREVFPMIEEVLPEAALQEVASRLAVKEARPRVEPWVPTEGGLSYDPWPGSGDSEGGGWG